MKESKTVRSFVKNKIVQIVVISLLDVAFFTIIMSIPKETMAMLDNKVGQALLILFWAILLANIFFILYDFYQFRMYRLEAHKLKRAAYIDELTGIPNRSGLDAIFAAYHSQDVISNLGLVNFSIKNLDYANTHLGHYAGDKLIQDFAAILEAVGDDFGMIGRNGSNNFLALLENCTEKKMEDFISAILEKLIEYNKKSDKFKIEISHSYVLNNQQNVESITELLMILYKK